MIITISQYALVRSHSFTIRIQSSLSWKFEVAVQNRSILLLGFTGFPLAKSPSVITWLVSSDRLYLY